MKESSVSRLLITLLIGVLGLGLTVGFISLQLQVGHITIIIGDKNEVKNGDQSQTVVQPVKPVAAQAKTEELVTEVATVSESQPQTQTARSQTHHQTTRTYYQDNEEEEYVEGCVCTCPEDETEENEPEESPEEEPV